KTRKSEVSGKPDHRRLTHPGHFRHLRRRQKRSAIGMSLHVGCHLLMSPAHPVAFFTDPAKHAYLLLFHDITCPLPFVSPPSQIGPASLQSRPAYERWTD